MFWSSVAVGPLAPGWNVTLTAMVFAPASADSAAHVPAVLDVMRLAGTRSAHARSERTASRQAAHESSAGVLSVRLRASARSTCSVSDTSEVEPPPMVAST